MDTRRVDQIIQYALAVASTADEFRERELGPIHLIKYVYLADLAYAERRGGETFTGAAWTFYKFGPFAQEVNARVEPAAENLGAILRTFSSRFGDDDVKRFSLRGDDGAAERLERLLPVSVAQAVRDGVRRFGNDTSSLLHHVYLTRPMLAAAPRDMLGFNPRPAPESTPPNTPMTAREEKRRKATLSEVKARLREMNARPMSMASSQEPYVPPNYGGEEFAEIRNLLAVVDGEPPGDESGEIVFDESVWHSLGRTAEGG